MNAVLVWWRRNAERYFIRWKLYSDMKKAREEANTVLILTPLIEVLKIRQAFRTWVVFYKAAVDMQAADDVWYSRALYEAFIHWTVFSKAILNMNTAMYMAWAYASKVLQYLAARTRAINSSSYRPTALETVSAHSMYEEMAPVE